MNIEGLRNEINKLIENGDNVAQNKQLKTALNQIEKRGLISDKSLHEIFVNEERLNDLLGEYKHSLLNDGKKSIRSPLTQVRNLAAFYNSNSLKLDGTMTFHEAIIEAVYRNYENVYVETLTPKTNKNIRENHTTLRSIAVELCHAGFKNQPEFWPEPTHGVISQWARYMRGVATPIHVPVERIHFMEDFFQVPRDTFVSKLALRAPRIKGVRKVPLKNKSGDKQKPKEKIELSEDLNRFVDEYSDYRIYGINPKIKLIPKILARRNQRVRVNENNKNEWTITEETQECVSKNMLIQALKSFTKFCCEKRGIDHKDVTLAHLTCEETLESWKNHIVKMGVGGFDFKRVIQQIKTSSGPRGYLRLCGTLGDRTQAEYFEELDMIRDLYGEWESAIDKNGIKKRDPKKNCRFLIDMEVSEMWEAVDNAIETAFNRARILVMDPVRASVERAYHWTLSATIFYLSRVKPIRVLNWASIRVNFDHNDFDSEVPSLTWYKKKNCYRLFVPVSHLKNRQRETLKDIDVFYDSSFNSVIDKCLYYRRKYIDFVINENGKYNYNPDYLCLKKSTKAKDLAKCIEDGFAAGGATMAGRFKLNTHDIFKETLPSVNQDGVNHHATRHIAATWWLNEHPNDFPGLAILLNDTLTVVSKTYAELNEQLHQNRISNAVVLRNREFNFD